MLKGPKRYLITTGVNFRPMQIEHSAAYIIIQDLIPSLAYVFPYYFTSGLNFANMLENALFVHAFGYIKWFSYSGQSWQVDDSHF